MAKNTQKPTLFEIFKDVSFMIGSPATLTRPGPRLATSDFLNMMNGIRRILSTYSQDTYRLAILIPEQNWIRMVARPYSLDGGIIRIDLQGQTRQLLKTGDCRQWQYENVCSGAGTDPNYVGWGDILHPLTAPDSFPVITFPSESDILEAYYPPSPAGIHGDREIEQPLTSGIFNVRTTGYGGNDPTRSDWPTVANPNSYLRDCFLIYLLTCLNYTTGTNGSIPYSPDEYLNSTWTEILELAAGGGTASVNPLKTTFIVDGHTYLVAIAPGAGIYNTTTNDPFVVTISTTVGGTPQVFTYTIYPNDTPWQTVSDPAKCTRWGSVFGSIQNQGVRGHYIAFNQRFINLPDDLEEIRRLWEIPMDIWRQRLDDTDPTADVSYENIVSSVQNSINTTSGAVQLFPIEESRFSWLKWLEAQNMSSDAMKDTGYYMKLGGRIVVAPRRRSERDSLYALLYVALDDKYDIEMAYADLQTTYVDLHGAQQELFTDYILWRYFMATQGSDDRATKNAQSSFMMHLQDAKQKMASRHAQEGDAPMIGRELPMGNLLGNKPYFDPIGSPEDWYPEILDQKGTY